MADRGQRRQLHVHYSEQRRKRHRMRLFFTIASILIMVAAAGMLYMGMETEKYWREKTQRPPAKS